MATPSLAQHKISLSHKPNVKSEKPEIISIILKLAVAAAIPDCTGPTLEGIDKNRDEWEFISYARFFDILGSYWELSGYPRQEMAWRSVKGCRNIALVNFEASYVARKELLSRILKLKERAQDCRHQCLRLIALTQTRSEQTREAAREFLHHYDYLRELETPLANYLRGLRRLAKKGVGKPLLKSESRMPFPVLKLKKWWKTWPEILRRRRADEEERKAARHEGLMEDVSDALHATDGLEDDFIFKGGC